MGVPECSQVNADVLRHPNYSWRVTVGDLAVVLLKLFRKPTMTVTMIEPLSIHSAVRGEPRSEPEVNYRSWHN